MPIPCALLDQAFLLATPDETIGALYARLPADRTERARTYIILPTGHAHYIVMRWNEIEHRARSAEHDIITLPFAALHPLPNPISALDQRITDPTHAQTQRDAQPGRRLVICDGAQIIGLLTADQWDDQDLGPDPFFGEDVPESPGTGGAVPDDDIPVTPNVPPLNPAIEHTPDAPPDSIPTTIPPPDAPPPTQSPPEDPRAINAWIDNFTPPATLEQGRTYTLHINIDTPNDTATTSSHIGKFLRTLLADQTEIEILIVLDSDDFAIDSDRQGTLIVPREGCSKNTLHFTITPQKTGRGVIKALAIANNRVFQRITIEAQIGTAATNAPTWTMASTGLSMTSAMARSNERPTYTINLSIIKKESSYQFRIQNGGLIRAALNLSEVQIAELISRARDTLKQIVYTLHNREYPYQREDTTIPLDIHTASLKTLAKLGYYLYQKIFYAPGNGPDAQHMGDLLRQLSQQHQLHIEIIPERFIFPWTLLYDRDPLDLDHIDPEGFWGFKHSVEYLPEFSSATPINFTPQITIGDTIGIGFVVNTTIDQHLPRPIIANQRTFLHKLQGVTVREYAQTQDLYTLLNDADMPNQLLYFYCHAISNIPGEKDGVDGSQVILSDGPILLSDLNIFAPTNRPPLKQAPLVFLNACQSAELSPYLYDGLVPYLVTRGARGVIGTEVDTPAYFAAEFAQELLTRFVAGGRMLGDVLIETRRHYLTQKNNVLGLLYALYSSGEVVIQRPQEDP